MVDVSTNSDRDCVGTTPSGIPAGVAGDGRRCVLQPQQLERNEATKLDGVGFGNTQTDNRSGFALRCLPSDDRCVAVCGRVERHDWVDARAAFWLVPIAELFLASEWDRRTTVDGSTDCLDQLV